MAKLVQEALLPGTDAIRKNTLEISPYRGKWLVRWKDGFGYVHRHVYDEAAEANEYYQYLLGKLTESQEQRVGQGQSSGAK